ncbi:unnamed protein product [Acanthoscelides obtectus]|uniref:Uncharacterized protein n=1 Tax=Acanthoscelides obtectus TaxID=200917 RepID=A0A9P0PS25_ACAOB|nr:unnamed protein product [Acanthoscelides obtectus]CAK1640634.1 hypothetical protein AOBTE_LOCUS11831 [Acanthoscelides obtectus]
MFGMWKGIFPCLRSELRLKLENSLIVIIASTVLYNIRIRCNQNHGDEVVIREEAGVNNEIPTNPQSGLNMRQNFVQQHFQ